MLVEKFGERVLQAFIAYAHNKVALPPVGPNIITLGEIEKKANDKGALEGVMRAVSTLSPLNTKEHLTRYECQNFSWVVAAFISLELSSMPLYMNSNFVLVREIARWRLKIGK